MKYPSQRKYHNDELRLVHLKSDPNNIQLQLFWKIRYDIFTGEGKNFYSGYEPEKYDLHPQTEYILIYGPNNILLGGRRMLVQDPSSKNKLKHLKTEDTIPIPLHVMLSHLPIKKMKCAEFGSLCFHKDIRGKDRTGESFLPYMYRESFKLAKERNIDLLVSEAVSKNIGNFHKAAMEAGMKQFHKMSTMLIPHNKETKELLAKTPFKLIDKNVYSLEDEKTLKIANNLRVTEKAKSQGALRGVIIKKDNQEMVLLSAFSLDGHFDVRTITTPLSKTEAPLLTPEMRHLSVGRVEE